jgi:hypothetical protein
MSRIDAVHDLNEPSKKAPRYHTNDGCTLVRKIRPEDVRAGSGGFYQCEECAGLNQ